MADLWLVSKERTDRLTDAETVRLGRTLIAASASSRVWYPDEAPTATVVVRDCDSELSAAACEVTASVLGDFDAEVRAEDA